MSMQLKPGKQTRSQHAAQERKASPFLSGPRRKARMPSGQQFEPCQNLPCTHPRVGCRAPGWHSWSRRQSPDCTYTDNFRGGKNNRLLTPPQLTVLKPGVNFIHAAVPPPSRETFLSVDMSIRPLEGSLQSSKIKLITLHTYSLQTQSESSIPN